MLFSVIMCTYNSKNTLNYAVESVLKQEWNDWELLILDNGSTDGTVDLLLEYEKQEQRISCIYRKDNVGWCKGISICLEQAKGQYMMFLGADDLLATERTFLEVANEIEKHQPDIIWTGNAVAVLENGVHKIETTVKPRYCILEKEDKLTQLYYIMSNVYYNSVMHYVRIDFLKKCGIDFYHPFYGDCQGMTEAIGKANKMVVLDKVEYILTANTSQTAPKVDFEYNIARQWQSVKEAVGDLSACRQDMLRIVAERIFINLACMCDNIAVGQALRDNLMNDVNKGIVERFLKAEEWISSDAFGEMMQYSNRLRFEEHLIGAAGVLYWQSKKYGNYAQQIQNDSKWLADFVEVAMGMDENGKLFWKTKFSRGEGKLLLSTLKNMLNPYHIGCELLLKDEIEYEELKQKEEIYVILGK